MKVNLNYKLFKILLNSSFLLTIYLVATYFSIYGGAFNVQTFTMIVIGSLLSGLLFGKDMTVFELFIIPLVLGLLFCLLNYIDFYKAIKLNYELAVEYFILGSFMIIFYAFISSLFNVLGGLLNTKFRKIIEKRIK